MLPHGDQTKRGKVIGLKRDQEGECGSESRVRGNKHKKKLGFMRLMEK